VVVVDHHVDGRSLRLQTAITTRLSSGWSWRMAQVVPPQYTLFLIYEMQDRIKESKIFIKIDIREEYYKIRMKKSEK
jgi:hypothetical protein